MHLRCNQALNPLRSWKNLSIRGRHRKTPIQHQRRQAFDSLFTLTQPSPTKKWRDQWHQRAGVIDNMTMTANNNEAATKSAKTKVAFASNI
jgi:hypothetical protein